MMSPPRGAGSARRAPSSANLSPSRLGAATASGLLPLPLADLFAFGRGFAPAIPGAYIACTGPQLAAPAACFGQRLQTMTIDDIIADFALIDDWEERYRYIIDLGKQLPPFPEAERTEANRVRGCASQVWLATHPERSGKSPRLHFLGDSDALIVRGLVAITLALFDRKSPREILATDAEAVFDKLDLRAHLTAQRSNGLRALVDRIRADAAAAEVA
jgi:cysteine desulfuration protein SufE